MNHELRSGVSSIRQTSAIPDPGTQQVLDAAASLQLRRGDLAARLQHGERVDAEVVAVGLPAMNEWLHDESGPWRSMLSTHPAAGTAQLRGSLPLTRHRVAEGQRLVSLFDHRGTEPEARALLRRETLGTYVFGVAPVQMKIIDQRFVLLQGPVVDGSVSLMKVWAPACLEAAWRYWRAAMAHLVEEDPTPPQRQELTGRQRQITSLLATDLSDDAIAETLGISVRTVRSDIAGVLAMLGVRSRFAAGARLRDWEAAQRR
jgi:DNA-binding CsgD family transcriptional regulator